MLPGNGAVQYGVVVPHSMPAAFDSTVAVSHRRMPWVTLEYSVETLVMGKEKAPPSPAPTPGLQWPQYRQTSGAVSFHTRNS